MKSDIEILIGLLESTKKDIITVVNARTIALGDQIKAVDDRVLRQNSRIGKLESSRETDRQDLDEDLENGLQDIDKRLGILETTSLTRGITCYKTLEDLKPARELVTAINWVARNKRVTLGIVVFMLFMVQSLVYAGFKYLGVNYLIESVIK